MIVKMINSVGDYVAGESYEISDDEAERFVIAGYAEGALGREVTDEEREKILEGHQVVNLGEAVSDG